MLKSLSKLNELKDANESVVLLTGTLASPSTEKDNFRIYNSFSKCKTCGL